MSRRTKALVAGIDAVVMGVLAYRETGGVFAIDVADLVLWGAVVAAAICAVVVLLDGAGAVAWASIGYVLFGAMPIEGGPNWPLAALALALMPLVPRPNRSLVLGLVIAVAAAVVARVIVSILVQGA